MAAIATAGDIQSDEKNNAMTSDPATDFAAMPSTPSNAPARRTSSPSATTRPVPPMGLMWHDINFDVTVRNPRTKQSETKQILKDVSGQVLPGEFLVIMGPSGAGKSSLLDCVAARNSKVKGSITVNGAKWSKAIAKRSCYVLQDDLFYANLTVLEHLTFQSVLRMGKQLPREEREQRIQDVISELGLTTCMHTLIGGGMVKGISGGQRKRLSFATELLTNPSLLFVDEPTSGLDSYMAETVVMQMVELAKRGRTVLATIHQPSSNLFVAFDRLYLMADGCVVYDGKASESMAHFASLNYECPAFMNPAEYYMKLLAVLDENQVARDRVQRLVNGWTKKLEEQQAMIDTRKQRCVTLQQIDTMTVAESTVHRVPISTQVQVLIRRNIKRLVRDPVAFRARFGSSVFVGLLAGLIFLQLDCNQTGIQDFTGAIFFISVSQFMLSVNPEMLTVPLEIPIIIREHAGGLYHALTWYAAKNVSELFMPLAYSLVFLSIVYFMVGFDANAELFFSFYVFVALNASTGCSCGYMVSCLSRRIDTAPMLGLMFMLPFLLFGGLFLNADSTPDYLIWLQSVSPIKYCFHGVMRAYWTTVDSIECAPGQVCRATTGQEVLTLNHIESDMMWRDVVVLIALNVGFRLLGALFLWQRLERKNV